MKSLGVYYWYIKIPQGGNVEHWLEYITCYVQKHIAHLAMCSNPQLVRDNLLGARAIVRVAYYAICRRSSCSSLIEFIVLISGDKKLVSIYKGLNMVDKAGVGGKNE